MRFHTAGEAKPAVNDCLVPLMIKAWKQLWESKYATIIIIRPHHRHLGLVSSHDCNLSVRASGVFDILALYKLVYYYYYYVHRCGLLLPTEYRGLSVCLSPSEPCKNGWSNRNAVCVEDSGGPKESPIRYSQVLRAEYCIVGLPYNTAI